MHRNSNSFLPTATFLVLCAISATTAAGGDHPWCYNDPKCAPPNWGNLCKTGQLQSPIDLKLRVFDSKNLRKIRINKAYKEGFKDFYVKNNGHTLQVQLQENLTSALRIDSDGFRKTKYQLSQLHFHWGSKDDIGSEHTINGTSFAMELHLVHFSEKYSNLLEAITDQNPRSLAVFGVLFEISEHDNPALVPIVESINEVRTYTPDPTRFTPSTSLNLSAFFPEVLDIYRYEGSLTTPSCGQKVVWTVFRNPVPVSKTQMEAFRSLRDTFGQQLVDNFRPTQPIGRRRVYEHVAHLYELPDTEEDELNSGIRTFDSSKENEIETRNFNGGHDLHDTDSQHRNNKTDKKSIAARVISRFGLAASLIGITVLHLF